MPNGFMNNWLQAGAGSGSVSPYPILQSAPVQGVQIGANGMSGYAMGSSTPAYMNPGGNIATGVGGLGAGSGSFDWGGAMGGASIGLSIGQAIGSVYSAFSSSKTAKYVLNKQAEIAENNRQMGQLSYESALRAGEGQIAQLTYQAGQTKAKQRTAYAANGVAVGEGSSAEVLASTDILKKMDTNTIKLNALSSAWGYKNQALQASAQSSIYSGLANYQSGMAVGKGLGAALEGGMEVANRWYKYKGIS